MLCTQLPPAFINTGTSHTFLLFHYSQKQLFCSKPSLFCIPTHTLPLHATHTHTHTTLPSSHTFHACHALHTHPTHLFFIYPSHTHSLTVSLAACMPACLCLFWIKPSATHLATHTWPVFYCSTHASHMPRLSAACSHCLYLLYTPMKA